MKLIHCADLHFDSKLNANLSQESAKERRAELLDTFVRMVAYAKENAVEAILIAGDLFDTKITLATARNTVLHEITSHPDISFYYLRGNHDQGVVLWGGEGQPDNLKTFSSQWQTYYLDNANIAISGIEFPAADAASVYGELDLDYNKFNIVILHGQEAFGSAKDKTEIINLKALQNQGIDYLALGHVHTYKEAALDSRGIYCYPGCLEGRGFDECGEHGFVLLDVDTESGHFTREFVPFARRLLYLVEVDVTGCLTSAQMAERAEEALMDAGCAETDFIKLVFTGKVDVACEKDLSYFTARFSNCYYYVKVCDETILDINEGDYQLDCSLKGEFVRQVMADSTIRQEDKKTIIRYGLQAIAGEEVQ